MGSQEIISPLGYVLHAEAKKIGKKYTFVSKNDHPKTLIPPPKQALLYVKKIREIFIFKEK